MKIFGNVLPTADQLAQTQFNCPKLPTLDIKKAHKGQNSKIKHWQIILILYFCQWKLSKIYLFCLNPIQFIEKYIIKLKIPQLLQLWPEEKNIWQFLCLSCTLIWNIKLKQLQAAWFHHYTISSTCQIWHQHQLINKRVALQEQKEAILLQAIASASYCII